MREQSAAAGESDWQPVLNREDEAIAGQQTYRTNFCSGEYENACTLVIQRQEIAGQASLGLDAETCVQGASIYRASATNRDALSESEIIQWYTRHAEDSANRITELKLDCGGDTLPCSECDANALYVLLSALSHTLCVLMRSRCRRRCHITAR